MVVMVVRLMLGMAKRIEAGFFRGFGFNGGVGDAVLSQFFTDGIFYLVCGVVGDDVQGGAVGVVVQAPEVDMVNVRYAADSREMVFEL